MRFTLLFLLTTLIINPNLFSQTISPDWVDGELHFKIDADPIVDLNNYTGGNVALDLLYSTYSIDSIYRPFKLPGTTVDSIYRVVFSNIAQVDLLKSGIEALPFVEYAEKNPLCISTHTPNDLAPEQWYLDKVMAEFAWNHSVGSGNILIAVVDNAIAIDHQDLAPNIYTNTAEDGGLTFLDDDANGFADDVNGYDLSDNDNNPRPPANASGNGDGFVHGTHVAGVVSAKSNNGVGIASLGYNCKILPVKVAPDSDGAAFNKTIDGIFYALRTGADIINMSWGTYNNVAVLHSMIQQATGAGIVLVAAAGNDNTSDPFYPAAYPEVISVGATDQNDTKAGFSNFGSTLDVTAPGVDIYSTMPEGNNTYANLSGTSMATPLVSALAGLILAQNGSFNAGQVRQRIIQGVDDISALNQGFNGQLGAGRINAFQSLGNVGLTEVFDETLKVYPNPVNAGSPFTINIGSSIDIQSIQVFDARGRLVESGTNASNKRLSIETPGLYTIVVNSEEAIITQRIIVTK